MTMVNPGFKGLTESVIKRKLYIIYLSNNPIAVLSRISFYDVQIHDIRTCIDSENQYIMQKRTYIKSMQMLPQMTMSPLCSFVF